MLMIFFLALLFIHGVIHLIGFTKGFNLATTSQITENITKPEALLWLLAMFLFVSSVVFEILGKEFWWMIAICAVVLSQVLIFVNWGSAKYGTLLNILLILPLIAQYGYWSFEKSFSNDVTEGLERTSKMRREILTEKDIKDLPLPVQKYLRYTGVINKEKILSAKIIFEGEMRDRGKDWFKFSSEQYSFFDEPSRLFYMKGNMFGMTVPVYHRYIEAKASMDVRIFGLLSVVKYYGEIINKTETVTLFNDMCIMAPASLIDNRINWEEIDSTSSKAVFTNRGITVSATLFFNEKGQLINFISDDRQPISESKPLRFSTPVSEYKNINGINVISKAEVIWHYPEGKFTYGKFNLVSIDYNISRE